MRGIEAVSTQPRISISRAAAIAREMFSVRRLVCEDDEFPNALVFWDAFADGNPDVRTKVYPSEVKNKAGVIELEGRVTLIISQDSVDRVKRGQSLMNFILAHEFCHIALDHHGNSATVKNFELAARNDGFAIEAPDDEELETHYAAVFLLCGPAILNFVGDAASLAKRARCDPTYVRKVLAAVALPEFRAAFDRLQCEIKRVVL